MYEKVLVPLDGSDESENVLDWIRRRLEPYRELILLQAIPPGGASTFGEGFLPIGQVEAHERFMAMTYLGKVRQSWRTSGKWRCEVTHAKSTFQGIVDFAEAEKVDLIAMYTHDRKGLAGIMKRSVAREVERATSMEVRVFSEADLVLAS
jgi:nucleotide-binding universal stress UspA family protein